MELTLSAQEAAEKAWRQIGKPRFGNNADFCLSNETEVKNRLLPVLLLILSLILISWNHFRDLHKIKGWASKEGLLLKNTSLFFCSKHGIDYVCKTNKEGDFQINIPSGRYSIYIIENGNKIKSPSVLRCESDLDFKVVFEKNIVDYR